MEKTFILLRAHKQQGPYTLAQMADLNLKADELVYVENNIAGWRAAGEIDVLKPYVSLTATTNEIESEVPVKKVRRNAIIIPEPTKINPVVPTPIPLKTTATSPEAARKEERIINQPFVQPEQVQISVPARQEEEVEATRDLSFKNAEPPVVAVNAATAIPYRRSTENTDIAYSGRVSAKKQKKVKRSPNKTMLVGAIALGVFAVGVLLNGLIGGKSNAEKTAVIQATRQQSGSEETKASIEAGLPKATSENTVTVAPPTNKTKEEKVEKTVTEPEIKKETIEPKTETSIAALQPIKTSSAPAVTEEKNTTPAEKTLQDQIAVQSTAIENGGESGIYGLNISLQNNSDKPLKMAAVNVFYTNDAGAVINKQTLYFSDVQPGQAVSRTASGHKVATKAHCKLGLVSSEGKIYYEN